MRIIILAAGQGFKLDGFNKILLKDPKKSKTILDLYLEIFPREKVTMVVGYNAITIMNKYPDLNYIYNPDWRTTRNSYSLSLALDNEPCLIFPSDLFFDPKLIELIKKGPKNCVLVANTENRTEYSNNCTIKDGKIVSIYQGGKKKSDPEIIGIYKICEKKLLKEWKKRCLLRRDLSAAESLPVKEFEIFAVDKKNYFLHEINTPLDYINFIKIRNKGSYKKWIFGL